MLNPLNTTKAIFYFLMVKLPKMIIGHLRGNLLFAYFGKHKNFGDQLTPLILNHYGFTTVFAHYRPRYSFSGKAEVVCVGTLLQHTPTDFKGIILGSGSNDVSLSFPFAQVLGVRGKLTLRNLEPSANKMVLGDPGLLVSYIYPGIRKKKYRLGIVPHFVDKNDSIIRNFRHRFGNAVKIIDVQRRPKAVIEDIKKCEHIVSSSLHGLITADAFDIPNIMFAIRRNMPSIHDHKYRDYYSTYNLELELIELNGDESLEYLVSKTSLKTEFVEPVKAELRRLFSGVTARMDAWSKKDDK